MRTRLAISLLASAYILSTALVIGQIDIPDINKENPHGTGTANCTGTGVYIAPPGWEWNCDHGSGSWCSYTVPGPICANTVYPAPASVNAPDGHAREMDLSWTYTLMSGNQNGGDNFHASINTTPDTSDTAFSYDVWVQHSDLGSITALEFDLNQVVTDGDTIIFGTQCNFDTGDPILSHYWNFTTYTDGTGSGPMGSNWNVTNIPCSKDDWPVNRWHHVVISFHRASSCTDPQSQGGTCQVTYDSVALDSSTPKPFTCGSNDGPCQGSSSASLKWCPGNPGCLVTNFQLDMQYTQSGSMKAYADLMTVNSPQDTQVGTPSFSPAGGVYEGSVPPITITTSPSSAAICYTTDGTTPTANGGGTCTHGQTYNNNSKVSIPGGGTLKAVGSQDGIDFDSAVETAVYSLSD